MRNLGILNTQAPMLFAVRAVGAILLADLVSGLVHWIEDSFWTENSPIVGRWIVTPNALHHRDGFAFTKSTWWQSSWDLVLAGLPPHLNKSTS